MRSLQILRAVAAVGVLWWLQSGVAYADNCGSPSDCFFSQRAAILALLGIATLGAFVVFGPAGAAATLFWGWDIAELATGRDMLSWERMPRWQAAVGMIDPTPGNVGSRGGRRLLREAAEEATEETAESATRRTARGGADGGSGGGSGRGGGRGSGGGDDPPGGRRPDGDPEWPTNSAGQPYPRVTDPRTGEPIHFPEGAQRVPPEARVAWDGRYDRAAYIKEWYDRGYETPPGGWSKYDIHHIQPREFGGSNDFNNLVPVERSGAHKEFNNFWRKFP